MMPSGVTTAISRITPEAEPRSTYTALRLGLIPMEKTLAASVFDGCTLLEDLQRLGVLGAAQFVGEKNLVQFQLVIFGAQAAVVGVRVVQGDVIVDEGIAAAAHAFHAGAPGERQRSPSRRG
jgi:hypothetical protein